MISKRELTELAKAAFGPDASIEESGSYIQVWTDTLIWGDVSVQGGTKAQRRRAIAAALREMAIKVVK